LTLDTYAGNFFLYMLSACDLVRVCACVCVCVCRHSRHVFGIPWPGVR